MSELCYIYLLVHIKHILNVYKFFEVAYAKATINAYKISFKILKSTFTV